MIKEISDLSWLPKEVKEIDIVLKALNFVREKVSNLTYTHTIGVVREAVLLSQSQNSIDLTVVILAAIFHDSAKDLTSFEKHADEGVKIFRVFCQSESSLIFKISNEQIENIEHCIKTHSSPWVGSGEMPKTMEAKILFDADMIQQMGPFGIVKHLEKHNDKEFEKRLLSLLRDLKVAFNALLTDEGRLIGKKRMEKVEEFVLMALEGK